MTTDQNANQPKLFISGISGLLGINLALQASDNFRVSGCYRTHPIEIPGSQTVCLDLCDLEATEKTLTELAPDLIIHTAGLTNVEQCESDPELAHRSHVDTTRNVAMVAKKLQTKLVHISTDHLFDGESPLRREIDPPSPINVYARTKLLAEQAALEICPDALVVRTNFFGWGTSIKSSFSDWILHGLKGGQDLTMFTDVYFTPILINSLVDTIFQLALRNASGIFNVASGQRVSKFEFAQRVAKVFQLPEEQVRPISVGSFSFNARRPRDMSLDVRKVESFLQTKMPSVDASLEELRVLEGQGWPGSLQEALGPSLQTGRKG
jgi:dTDP-4-dehydrorhamnose reductase